MHYTFFWGFDHVCFACDDLGFVVGVVGFQKADD